MTLSIDFKPELKDKVLDITASDISLDAIMETENNLKHAKLREYVNFSTKDILDTKPPVKHGVMLTNPPYGVRLNELDELATLYPKIASHLKQSFDNWSCYFFTADLRLPKLMRLKPSKKTPLFNGALDCRLFEFKMVRGSNR